MNRNPKEVIVEHQLIYLHCRKFGTKLEESMFRVRGIWVGSEFKSLLERNNIPFNVNKQGVYTIIIDGDEMTDHRKRTIPISREGARRLTPKRR